MDHARVVDLLRKADHLPLVKEYLLAVQKTNLGAINEAVRRPRARPAAGSGWHPRSLQALAQACVGRHGGKRARERAADSRCGERVSRPHAVRIKDLLMRGLHRAAPCWRKPGCLASPERLAGLPSARPAAGGGGCGGAARAQRR